MLLIRILQTLLPQLPRQISRPQVVVALVLCSVVWSSQKNPQAAGRGPGGLGVALEHLNDGLQHLRWEICGIHFREILEIRGVMRTDFCTNHHDYHFNSSAFSTLDYI